VARVFGEFRRPLKPFVGTKQKPKEHGAGILRNASIKVIGQQPGDVSPLIEHLSLNEVALNEISASPRRAWAEVPKCCSCWARNRRQLRRSVWCRRRSMIGWRPRIRENARTHPASRRLAGSVFRTDNVSAIDFLPRGQPGCEFAFQRPEAGGNDFVAAEVTIAVICRALAGALLICVSSDAQETPPQAH
jgi:hypothetical protein